MATVRPIPASASVFLDSRGDDRALRVTWHYDSDLVVLSLWRENVCTGSFRLTLDEVPQLVAMLRSGLDTAYTVTRSRQRPEVC